MRSLVITIACKNLKVGADRSIVRRLLGLSATQGLCRPPACALTLSEDAPTFLFRETFGLQTFGRPSRGSSPTSQTLWSFCRYP